MNAGDIAPPGAWRDDRNIVLDDDPALSAAHFICREPRYVGMAWRTFWVVLGCVLAYLALSAPMIAGPLRLVFWITSGLGLVAALRQASGTIHFASDSLGVYFPSRQRLVMVRPATPQRWLFVPWSNVSSIGVQLLLDESGSSKGVTFSLCASAEERRVYFPGAATRGVEARSPAGGLALIRVGYPGASGSPDKVVVLLRGLQGRPMPSVC